MQLYIQKIKKWSARIDLISFINYALLLICLVSFVYFLSQIMGKNEIIVPDFKKDPLKEMNIKIDKPANKSISYYIGIMDKNVFKMHDISSPPIPPSKIEEEKKINIRELAAKLSIQGIITDAEPQIIIQNKEDQSVFYLKEGEYIGELKIDKILRDRVILKYGDQTLKIMF